MSLLDNFIPPQIKMTGATIKIVAGLVISLIVILFVSQEIDKVETFLGMDTKANLEKKLAAQAQSLKTVVDANSSLSTSVASSVLSDKVTDTVVADNTDEINKSSKVINIIDNKRQVDIFKINTDSKITKEDPQVTINKISTIQINSIWKTYCEFNNDSTCNSIN